MNKNTLLKRITLITVFALLSAFCSVVYCNTMTTHDYEIDCQCYASDFSTIYMAIQFYVNNDPTTSRYQFEFEEMSGDLDIDEFDIYLEDDWWVDGTSWYTISPYNVAKKIELDITVLKNDIEPGASRNFRLKYRKKDHRDDPWGSYQYSQEFTVSVEDITVSGTAGTLCNSSRSYSISLPTGYTSNWSFSNSNLVSPSSGSGSSASISGTCNGTGDGVLTFTMTKSNCPSFQATRTINVNGPDPSDLSLFVMDNLTGQGVNPMFMCPNTTYVLYCDNSTSCSTSNYIWTLPYGMTQISSSQNWVLINTNSSPGGILMVHGQTCCSGCGSNVFLMTDVLATNGYNCGGYYMASPNPGSSYIDIDVDPEMESLKEASFDQDIILKMYDKMGTIVHTSTIKSLPYRIDTSVLPQGIYVVYMINGKNTESLQVLVEH